MSHIVKTHFIDERGDQGAGGLRFSADHDWSPVPPVQGAFAGAINVPHLPLSAVSVGCNAFLGLCWWVDAFWGFRRVLRDSGGWERVS